MKARTRLPYEIRRTNFHAAPEHLLGDCVYHASTVVASRHHTESAARAAVRRWRSGTQCACGCLVLIRILSDGTEVVL